MELAPLETSNSELPLYETMKSDDFDRLQQKFPEADVFVSLVGLPSDAMRMKMIRQGGPGKKPALLLIGLGEVPRRRLAEAQQLRERKLNALNAEVARLAALKDYGKLRLVYQEVMELVDVGSVPYDKARRGLFAVDNALRGKLK